MVPFNGAILWHVCTRHHDSHTTDDDNDVESDDNMETEDQSSDDEDGEVDDLLDEALDNDTEEEERIMTDSKPSVTEVCTAPATAKPVSLLP